MRRRSIIMLAPVLAFALTACATPVAGVGGTAVVDTPAPEPSDAIVTQATGPEGTADADAHAQAQAWLDVAALPPGAVPADASVASFSSYTGWPCGPVAELEAFWLIPDATVSETANWLGANPTGDLISTAVRVLPADSEVTSATVGYIPAEGAQEGIVYTVEKTADGVAVRAEVAAQAAGASCPVLPDGAQYGAPGQG